MMQHGHGIDADALPELAHRKAHLAVARQHVEGRIEDVVAVEAPPAAGLGMHGLARCLP